LLCSDGCLMRSFAGVQLLLQVCDLGAKLIYILLRFVVQALQGPHEHGLQASHDRQKAWLLLQQTMRVLDTSGETLMMQMQLATTVERIAETKKRNRCIPQIL
jgi:hypothetical protein